MYSVDLLVSYKIYTFLENNTLSLSSATLAQLDFLILIDIGRLTITGKNCTFFKKKNQPFDNFIVVLKLSLKSTAGAPVKYSITDHMERYSPLYGECTLLSKSKMYCLKARKKVSRDCIFNCARFSMLICRNSLFEA